MATTHPHQQVRGVRRGRDCLRCAGIGGVLLAVTLFTRVSWGAESGTTQLTVVNPTAISIPTNNAGPATPYPSTISVTGLTGFISHVSVTISNLSHTWPSDVDVLLTSPAGQGVILLSDAGSDHSITYVTLTFDDGAPKTLPKSSRIVSGRYKPTNHSGDDFFPAPAPDGPYGASLSVFNAYDPDGLWRLYVVDSEPGDGGAIADGWSLTITVTNQQALPSINISDPVLEEGQSGITNAVFIVSLSSTSSLPVAVDYETADGTATANTDYVPQTGTILFPPGSLEQTALVPVIGDILFEPHETFFLLLSQPTNAILADAIGMATIRNDDSLPLADAFAERPVVSGILLTMIGFNTGASREPGEPEHAGNPGGASVWWSWRAPAAGGVNVFFGASTFNPLLAVYTGESLSYLALVADNRASAGFTDQFHFNAVSNMTYIFAVDGVDGQTGDFILQLGLRPGQFYMSSEAGAEVWVPNGPVLALAELDDVIYLGGEFTHLSPNVGKGELWETVSGLPVPGFPRANGPIYTAVPDGHGGWFLGGEFTQLGETGRTNLAHLLPGNVVDPNWPPWTDGFVFELVLASDRLYVGGSFTNFSGLARWNLAAVDPGTGTVTDWQPVVRHALEPEVGAAVRAIAVAGNTVFVGGTFTEVGRQPRSSLAALDASTGQATAWNPAPAAAEGVVIHALVVHDETVFVGGKFTYIGGQPRNNLAALDIQSGLATPWAASADAPVLTLQSSCNTLYSVGNLPPWMANRATGLPPRG